jgi:hypothetical protein
MTDDDLDNLLRDHLRAELIPQRGRAEAAFREALAAPSLDRLRITPQTAAAAASRSTKATATRPARPIAPSTFRHAFTVGLSLAACVAIAFVLPPFLHRPGAASDPVQATSGERVVEQGTIVRDPPRTPTSPDLQRD